MSSRRPAYCSVRRAGCGLRERCGKTSDVAMSERQIISDMLATLSQHWNSVTQLASVR